MGEADFAAVDGAVARGFDDGEDIVVFGVEDDAFSCCLYVELVMSVEPLELYAPWEE
jgi:hypothetical protein